MNGLAMVTDQLRAVARHTDWRDHGAHMDDEDAELAELNQQIKIVISLRDFVGQMDDHFSRQIAAGKLAAATQVHDLFLLAMDLFAEVCNAILPAAEDFARQGFRVEELPRFREIAANPSADLVTAMIAREAKRITASDGSVMETPFDPALFEAASKKGGEFRHLGND